MKIISKLQLTCALRLRGTFLALLVGCFAAGLAATYAVPLSLQPLLPGNWPGGAVDVEVVGNYAMRPVQAAGGD